MPKWKPKQLNSISMRGRSERGLGAVSRLLPIFDIHCAPAVSVFGEEKFRGWPASRLAAFAARTPGPGASGDTGAGRRSFGMRMPYPFFVAHHFDLHQWSALRACSCFLANGSRGPLPWNAATTSGSQHQSPGSFPLCLGRAPSSSWHEVVSVTFLSGKYRK